MFDTLHTGQARADGMDSLLGHMRRFREDRRYYALWLLADRRGGINWSAFSIGVGRSPRNPRWEVRKPDAVKPSWFVNLWDNILKQDWVAVHDEAQLAVFLRLGGNVLIDTEVAHALIPHAVAPAECVRDIGGFKVTEHLPDAATHRKPSAKLRNQVLKRDNYRCVQCGRRAADYLDIELHVHHVIPWKHAGPTSECNLVTLCSTCHRGLDPHSEYRLRELAKLPGPAGDFHDDLKEFSEGVRAYRAMVARAFK
jgi:hypothetical protein